MKLHQLRPARGSKRKRKRVGRGISAGQGKTAGRGTKGQGARSGGSLPEWFEGGQTPLMLRLPHKRGFHNIFKIKYEVVNLGRLGGFAPGARVDPLSLAEAGITKSSRALVKILGRGDLDRPLHISAHAFSRSAKEKIEAAGGSFEELSRESESANRGR